MAFPKIRMRRLRTSSTMRRLVRQTILSVDDLVYPLFIKQGEGLKEPNVLLDGGEPVRNAPASFAEQGQEVVEVKSMDDHFCVKVRRRK